MNIAYQVVGTGPPDLVLVRDWVSKSDRVAGDALPTLEERVGDLRAVMDAIESARAALLGISEWERAPVRRWRSTG